VQRLGVSSTPSIFVNGRPVKLRADRPASDQIGEIVGEELTGHPG
jgi:protein-disulfide isomerase